MKCDKHNKAVISSCQWCGKQLCRMCVGKRLGTKMFCTECGTNLSDIIERRQLDMMRQQQAKTNKEREVKNIFG